MSGPALPSIESLASLDRDALAFISFTLRSAVIDEDGEVAEWFRPGYLLEVANVIDKLSRALHGPTPADPIPETPPRE